MNSKELQQFVYNLIKKTQNPGRIKIGTYDDRNFLGIFSRKGTNDTSDWYMVNSPMIESEVKKAGLSWSYLFDTIKNDYPVVSMFIGKGINAQTIRDFAIEMLGHVPNHSHFDDGSYKDVCDNYREISVLEEKINQIATNGLRYVEP